MRDLMKFLYEADHSPMLIILDALTAAPQQRNNQINATIRFQAIVREPARAGGKSGNDAEAPRIFGFRIPLDPKVFVGVLFAIGLLSGLV